MRVKLSETLPDFAEVWTFSSVITAVAQDGLVENMGRGVVHGQGVQCAQHVDGSCREKADELQEADASLVFSPYRAFKCAVKDVGAACDEKESRLEQDEHLVSGDTVQAVELHVAFPSLKDHLDAPAQTVNSKQPFEVRPIRADSRDEDGPAHEFQNCLGRIVAMGLLPGLHASDIGGFFADRSTHQTHLRAGFVVKEHGNVKEATFPQPPGQIDRLAVLWVEINGAGFMAVDAISPRLHMSLDFAWKEVAAVAQNQVASFYGQFGSGRLVVLGIGVDGEAY